MNFVGSAKLGHGSLQFGELTQVCVACDTGIVVGRVPDPLRTPEGSRICCRVLMGKMVCVLTDFKEVSHARSTIVVTLRTIAHGTSWAALGAHIGGSLCWRLPPGRGFMQFAYVAEVAGATHHAASRGRSGAC